MISIVLPTYNGAKYIVESIQSVINQTYEEWELIVIDDCSTDETNRIVQSFAANDSRIKLYRNETNQRLPASLNIGFNKTVGELLTWTSDDNIFKPFAFEKMYKCFSENPEVGFVFSNMEIIDADGKLKEQESYIPKSMDELKYRNIVGASFMYTRNVYKNIGDYDVDKFLVEDYDYWLKIARRYLIHYIPEVLYSYRRHPGSLTESRNAQMLETKIKLYEDELKIEGEHLPNNLKCALYNELAVSALGLNNFPLMKHYVKEYKKNGSAGFPLDKRVKFASVIGRKMTMLVKRLKKGICRKYS